MSASRAFLSLSLTLQNRPRLFSFSLPISSSPAHPLGTTSSGEEESFLGAKRREDCSGGEMAASATVVAAVAVVVLATVAAGALGEIVAPRDYNISSPPVYTWTAAPDPRNQPYYMPEPAEDSHKVFRCWGYLARGKAVREMRDFLVNGTVPTSNTCDGVNRLHPHCWPDMFNIFWQVTPRRLHRLRQFCLKNGTLPPADHFDFA